VDGRTDGKTDITKLIVAFHNFANAPKKDSARYRFSFAASVCFRTNPLVGGGARTGSANEQRFEANERTLYRDSYGRPGTRNEVPYLYCRIIHKALYFSRKINCPQRSLPQQILTFRSKPSADSVLVIVPIVVTTDNNNIIIQGFNKNQRHHRI